MTLDELADYAKSQFTLTQTEILDWWPANDMYCVPYGIRFWLKNGDSIIYVKNKKEGGEVG